MLEASLKGLNCYHFAILTLESFNRAGWVLGVVDWH